MNLNERLAAERGALDAAKARITSEDEAEIRVREEIERVRTERLEVEARERDLDLARRLDAARERHGAKAQIATLAIDGHPDTYVLVHSGKAFDTWTRSLRAKADGKKVNPEEASHAYAMAVIDDWNGITEWTSMVPGGEGKGPTTATDALSKHLQANRAQVNPIVNEAAKLAGFLAEARKSGS